MTRREALLSLTALLGGAVFGAGRFLAGPPVAGDLPTKPLLTAADLDLLEEVAETIVPATAASGGAKAAKVGMFIAEIARDYYDPAERALLTTAPRFFAEETATHFPGRDFPSLSAAERHALLLAIDRRQPQPPVYQMVKQLTLWGYWTSEVAAKEALTYLPVPGVYRGCVEVPPGTKALF